MRRRVLAVSLILSWLACAVAANAVVGLHLHVSRIDPLTYVVATCVALALISRSVFQTGLPREIWLTAGAWASLVALVLSVGFAFRRPALWRALVAHFLVVVLFLVSALWMIHVGNPWLAN